MAGLRERKRWMRYPGVEENFTASCSFGSIFQKEFRFLTCNMKASTICKPCSRDHEHVKIQGQLTKDSAVHCSGRAAALADLFAKHLEVEEKFMIQHARP